MKQTSARQLEQKQHQTEFSWASLQQALQSLGTDGATAQPMRSESSEALVIIGAGASAQALRVRLEKLGYSGSIVIINGESYVPYNRAQISSAIADGRPLQTLAVRQLAQTPTITTLNCVRVLGIDRERKQLQLDNGQQLPYQRVVFATGGRSFRLPLLQTVHPRLRDFRTLADLQALSTLQPKHVLIVGGGLLGVEAARAARAFCDQVTLVERFPHLLPRQMDAAAAELLGEQLTAMGIKLLTGRQLAAVTTHDDHVDVVLDDQRTITTNLLISATGVVPEIELAKSAGLTVGRGIIVDEEFRTSDEHIFALGECCEQNGQTFGSLGPCLSHADRLAATLTQTNFDSQSQANVFQLKLGSHTVVSIGNTRPIDATNFHYQTPQGQYRRLFIEERRIVGAILYDDANINISAFTAAVGAGLVVSDADLQQFCQTGQLPTLELPVDAQIICFCANVSAGQLLTLRSIGKSKADIIASTGASSHCGSCSMRVDQLLGAKPSRYNQIATVVATAIVGLLLLGLLAGISAPYATSWTSAYRVVDNLWRDSWLRQVTGYTLLAIMLLSIVWGFWRRQQRLRQQRQSAQLGSHALFAAAAVLLWYLHTGGRAGSGLNFGLLLALLAVSVTGALAGAAWLQAAQSPLSRRAVSSLRALHWFALAPAPALLIFHILKAYYF